MKNENIERLENATADHRAQYIARVQDAFLARYRTALAELEAAGWDLDKVAPYPHGNMGKAEYRLAEARHKYFRSITLPSKSTRSFHEPDIRLTNPAVETKLRDEATRAANHDFDAYLAKLNGKINATITAAQLIGNLWNGSTLTVSTPEGSQVWTTQCIINVSVYGKLFNQWPTRRKA